MVAKVLIGPAEATFLPDAVPRRGSFAFWRTGGGPDQVELVFDGGQYGVRKRMVSARVLPVTAALPGLLSIDPNGSRVPRSLGVWASAATAGVGLIARGRILPAVTADGTDAWRTGPLDSDDEAWLRELAAAFPPEAHALAIPGSRPMRLRSPESLIRDLWDAIADVMVRTPAAPRVTGSPAFGAPEPVHVGDLSGWLADSGISAGARLGLRVEAWHRPAGAGEPADTQEPENPEDPENAENAEPGFRVVLQLRSSADPSLIVDAATLWDQPQSVLSRFGTRAETDLLLALRRGTAVWPPLGVALGQARPAGFEIDDDAIADLLGSAAEELAGAGIEVLWPSALLDDDLTATAVPMQAPGQVTDAGLNLQALLSFRWRLTLGGEELDETEVAELAEAKRPLVRIRDRWVTLNPLLLARLRRPPRTRMSTIEALGAVLAGSAEIDGERVEVAAEGALAELADRVAALAAEPEVVDSIPGLVATLRPYQRRGVAWLAGMCAAGFGGCLADDMGLGKTIQIIALHLHRRATSQEPTLVVCPASLLGTWEREIRKFAPGVPVRRFHGGERHLSGLASDEIVLVTYGILLRDTTRLGGIRWGLIVADEAQAVKNPESRGARALRELPAAARVALTGTPVENRLTDLWAILDWTTPGLLGHLEGFTRSIAVPIERYRDLDTTVRFSRLIRPFLLRRKKTDPGIAPELPPKTETDRIVPLTGEQVTLYEAVVRETMAAIAEAAGIERAGLVFKLLTALKQICNHPAQYLKQTGGSYAGRSGKLAAFDELLDIIIASGESMLVFTQFTQLAAILQEHLDRRGIGSLFLHGGTPIHRREEMVDEFQAGMVPVFLLSLKAGGTGLTLTRATHVLHYDRWWNPAVEDQATDRAYRIGQDKPVQVHRLIAEGTLEDRIAELLEKKRDLAEAVVGSGEGWITELSNDELAELVSLREAP
jgi:superfamily II DNA or RNA helicase